MKVAEKLRDEIRSIETRAAGVARDLAAQLMRPVPEREGMDGLLDDFEALCTEAEHRIAKLRRMAGRRAALAEAEAGQTLAGFARAARTRLILWGHVGQAVADCMAGYDWPLLPAPRARFDLGAVQASVMNKVFTDAHKALNQTPQADDAAEMGMFSDIPLAPDSFVRSAHLAARLLLARKQARPHAFLDVGCGGGMKVALAAEFFERAEGLDYDPGYVEVAERNFAAMKATRCRVFQADGLTFEGYGDYDVVYFYQPMHPDYGLFDLERQIVAHVPEGTILVAPYLGFLWRAEELGCRQIEGHVFVKGMDAEAVEAWKAETARMGPHVQVHGKAAPKTAGWLRPLWLACLANGIRPEG